MREERKGKKKTREDANEGVSEGPEGNQRKETSSGSSKKAKELL